MQKRIQRVIFFLFSFILFFTGCAMIVRADSDEVAVLFTNDIHGGIDDNIGYAGLLAYKTEIIEQFGAEQTVLVDCGDHLQGSALSLISNGSAVTEIMNNVGYDFATTGNHEFDFQMSNFFQNCSDFQGQYLCCNITYTGTKENPLSNIKPYAIKTFDDFKVGFIGVATPNTIKSSSPSFYKEDGKTVYDFADGKNGQRLYDIVQKNINACQAEGADFIIILSHLGVSETDAPYRSTDLIANTTGIDAVLDGHSHTVMNETVRDKNGHAVYLAQTGTELADIGKMCLSKNDVKKTINIELISDYTKKDTQLDAEIKEVQKKLFNELNKKIGYTEQTLSIFDENNIRMVRNRECALGELTADAIRLKTNSDVAFINGGAVRQNIEAGDITVNNVLSINPFINYIVNTEIKGSDLADILEYYYKETPTEPVKDGKAMGEFGGFLQISGMRITIDTAIPASILYDEANNFIGIGETRRIRDIEILQNGIYQPLDPDKIYTVSSISYLLMEGGDGIGDFLPDHIQRIVYQEKEKPFFLDLSDFIENTLQGDVSRYYSTDGRLNIMQHICEESLELYGKRNATETESGYTGDLRCRYCHKIFAKGENIPKLLPHAQQEKAVDTGIETKENNYFPVSVFLLFTAALIAAVYESERVLSDRHKES